MIFYLYSIARCSYQTRQLANRLPKVDTYTILDAHFYLIMSF